jgi:hypothetical protein
VSARSASVPAAARSIWYTSLLFVPVNHGIIVRRDAVDMNDRHAANRN